MIEVFASTGKPYLQISGLWIYGNNTSITEESPINAPALVAWKEAIERRVLDAREMRGVVIVSATAYGDGGGGVPGVLLGSPRDDHGNLLMLGTGQQHWSTVHVADLADFFRRALEDRSARGRYVIANGLTPTVADLTEAAAVATGAPGRSPVPKRRPGHAWATTSPKSCCSIRSPTRPRPGPSSIGIRPVRDWSRSFARGATAR